MDDPATRDDVGRRIGRFCVGLAVASASAFVGWVAFTLSATDFYADWWQGWSDARTRLADRPGLAAVVGLAAAFAGVGVAVMGWSAVGWQSKRPQELHRAASVNPPL